MVLLSSNGVLAGRGFVAEVKVLGLARLLGSRDSEVSQESCFYQLVARAAV